MAKLGEVCDLIVDGNWIESKDQSESGIRLIQTGNIGNGEYLDKENRAKYISQVTFEELNCTEVFSGDILISRLPDPVGRACVVPSNLGKAITAVDCSIVRLNELVCDKQYFINYTQSERYAREIAKYLAGTTRKRISRKNLEKVEIPLPEIEEQRAVAGVLDKVSFCISKKKLQLEKLDMLVKSRFIEMFGDECNSYHLPIVHVEDVADVQVGVVIKPAQYYTDSESGIKTFRSLNVGPMYVKDTDWVYFTEEGHQKNKKSILKENDLLIVRSGAPGTACVVTKEYAGCNAVDIIIAHPDLSKINSVYLCQYTNMPHGKKQIEEGTGGAAQQHFNVGKYNKMVLFLPPLDLQNQFADFVAQVDKSKLAVQKSLEQLEILKKALMQAYFG